MNSKVITHLLLVISHYLFVSCENEVNNYRLINSCEPIHYDVEIKPYLETAPVGKETFTFDGRVNITFKSVSTTSKIQLHANLLIIDNENIKITSANQVIPILKTNYNNITDILSIELAYSITGLREFFVVIEYSGMITDSMFGFYYSTYKVNDEINYLAITQLQQTEARKLLPCIDEPSPKSTFQLTVMIPEGYSVISNTEPLSESKTYVKFKQTPIMPSYLLAFMISKFEANTNEEDNFSVWARPELIEYTDYSLEVGIEILNTLELTLDYNYYETNYSSSMNFERLNMIAVPDIIPGGMENWGMITYKESGLIYHPNYTSDMAQQKIAAVIAHEIAHAWFGNLVTCAWWDYAWLNEAFSRYLQYFIPHILNSDWEMDKQFIVEQLQPAMLYDTSYKTHPLTHPVETQDDANAIFDFISYNKGSTIIRMVYYLLGHYKFYGCLRKYLLANSFKSVMPQNLFDAFNDEVSVIDANEYWEPWVQQSGYPIITVEVAEDRGSAIITQNKFHYIKAEQNPDILWPVHLIYSTGNSIARQTEVYLLTEKNTTLNFISSPLFVLFNYLQHGYYRVDYDLITWKNINNSLRSINYDRIGEINRAQIVDDLFNLARAGYHDYEFVFGILSYLKKETNYLPWYSAFISFHYLSQRMNNANLRKFRDYIHDLLIDNFDMVGFTEHDDDTRLAKYHRNNVLYWFCKTGNATCIKSAQNIFSNYKNNNILVPVNIRPAVYCTAMHFGDETDFDFLWTKFIEINIATEKVVILNALGCVTNDRILTKYLDYIFEVPSQIRKQDRFIAFSSTYQSYEENISPVLNYVLNQYEKIVKCYGTINQVAVFLIELLERISTHNQINDVESFLKKHETYLTGMMETLNVVLELAKDNVAWAEKRLSEIINLNSEESEEGGSSAVAISYFVFIITIVVSTNIVFFVQ